MPTEVPKPKAEHKVKKGESIDQIAKKYGFKNIDDIWDYPRNKALVKQRKEPAAIQPGDVVVIPAYNDKERAEIQKKQENFIKAAGTLRSMSAALTRAAAVEREAATAMAEEAAKHAAHCDALRKEVEASFKLAANWSDGVDVAATLINIGRGIKELAKKGDDMVKQADSLLTEKCGAKINEIKKGIEKANKELNTLVAGFLSGPVISEKVGAAISDPGKSGVIGDLRLFTGVLVTSYSKLTSPAFYGQTAVMLYEGKGWSEAAAYDLKDESKTALDALKMHQATVQKAYKDKIAACEKRAAQNEAAAKTALDKANAFSKEAFDR